MIIDCKDSCREKKQVYSPLNTTHDQLCIPKTTRRDMGIYLCIASNGIYN